MNIRSGNHGNAFRLPFRIAELVGGIALLAGVWAQAGTWDTTISTNYPGGWVDALTASSNALYATDGSYMYAWSQTDKTWQSLTDSTVWAMSATCIAYATNFGNYVFALGTVHEYSSTNHTGLFAWDLATATWSQIGGADLLNTNGSTYGFSALAIGLDGYIYIGLGNSGNGSAGGVPLPNGQTASFVCRYNLGAGHWTSTAYWDNMLGGISTTMNPDYSGVWSLGVDSFTTNLNWSSGGQPYSNYTSITMVYIGGLFPMQTSNGYTFNIVGFVSPNPGNDNTNSLITSTHYLAPALTNNDTYGVGDYYCTNDTWAKWETGPGGVESIAVVDNGTSRGAVIAGSFEPDMLELDPYTLCNPSASMNGIAQVIWSPVVKPVGTTVKFLNTFQVEHWGPDPHPDYCDCSGTNGCHDDIGINVVSTAGTNVYVAGGDVHPAGRYFNSWPPYCTGTNAAFIQASIAGGTTSIDTIGFDGPVWAVCGLLGVSNPVYVGGYFYNVDGTQSLYISQYDP